MFCDQSPGLLRIQPASSRDEPAEGAGDRGVGGELRIEEFAGHDGTGEGHGPGPGEDADKPKGGADGDGERGEVRQAAAEARADHEERGDFPAAEAGPDAEGGEEELERGDKRGDRVLRGVLGEVDPEAGERRELAEPDEAGVEEADHEDHVIRRGERAMTGGLPSPVERDEGQVGAGDQAEGDAERRGPEEASDGQVGREDETEVRMDGPAEVATDGIGPKTGEEAER